MGFLVENSVVLVGTALMLVLFGGGSYVLGKMKPQDTSLPPATVQTTEASAPTQSAQPASDTVTTSAPTITTQAPAATPPTKAPVQTAPAHIRPSIRGGEEDDD